MSQAVIQVTNLQKQYGKQKVINGVTFQVQKGSICGLVGPNGAGKTTIMKMLGGLVEATDGELVLFGKHDRAGLEMSRTRMSFLIETPYMTRGMTGRQHLEKQRLQKGIPDKKRVDEVLSLVGLSEEGDKKIKHYSLGMKQRLGIANALLNKPELMILDEPVNGLDPAGIVEIRELLVKLNREEEITILISSHILNELSMMCTDYLFLAKGVIVKTITDAALRDTSKSYIGIHTDNDAVALAVLQEQLQVEHYMVKEDGSIRLFDYLDDVRIVSKTLFENGIVPLELYIGGENLEEYYMSMIGGA